MNLSLFFLRSTSRYAQHSVVITIKRETQMKSSSMVWTQQKLVGLEKKIWFRSFLPAQFMPILLFCSVASSLFFRPPMSVAVFFSVSVMHFNSITRCMIILHRCTGLRPVFSSFGWSFILTHLIARLSLLFFVCFFLILLIFVSINIVVFHFLLFYFNFISISRYD